MPAASLLRPRSDDAATSNRHRTFDICDAWWLDGWRMLTDRAAAPPQPVEDRTVSVSVVTSPDCHLCNDALSLLGEFAAEGLLDLHVSSTETTQGRRLVAEHRPALFPLVVVNDEYFSAGRLSRGKLTKLLSRTALPAARL